MQPRLSAIPLRRLTSAVTTLGARTSRGEIMLFNVLIRIAEQPPRADKSAVGAIMQIDF